MAEKATNIDNQENKVDAANAETQASTDDSTNIINDLKDKMLRAMAEAENTRRRADLDIQNARNFSIQSFAKDLLGVMDNLCRAADSISQELAQNDINYKNLKDGVDLTKNEMINVLERHGIKRINPVGQVFDPNFHQVISQISNSDVQENTVIEVLQAGYVLKDRLIRPALVVTNKQE